MGDYQYCIIDKEWEKGLQITSGQCSNESTRLNELMKCKSDFWAIIQCFDLDIFLEWRVKG